ncbi:MAG: Ig-like domain repeat protein [Terracidiphilus sp.]
MRVTNCLNDGGLLFALRSGVQSAICSAQTPKSHTIEHLVFNGTTTCTESYDSLCNSFGSSSPITGNYSVDITANTIIGAWSFSTPFGVISSSDTGAQAYLTVTPGSNIQPYFGVSTSTVLEFVKFNFPISDTQETGAIITAPGSDACINIPGGENGLAACDPNDVLTGSNALSWSAAVSPHSGAPFGKDGLPETMSATFMPMDANSFFYGLTAAATDLGFESFNWQQQINFLPGPSPFVPTEPQLAIGSGIQAQNLGPNCKPDQVPADSDCWLQAPPAFSDPPLGGYTYMSADPKAYPFLWGPSALSGVDPCTKTTPVETSSTLLFEDCPGDNLLFGAAIEFTTSLVGVLPSGLPSAPLLTWTWQSTFDGTNTGGVSQTVSTSPTEPESGTGGVALTSIDGVSVTPLLTPTVTVSPSAQDITASQAVGATVVVSGASGNPTPTGSVTLTGGGYASSATALGNGSAAISIPAGSLAIGSDTLTAVYSGDNNYDTHAGTATIVITAPPAPSFSLSGASISIAPGATSGNTSTITVTPSGGFTGSVTLSASITSSPNGAQYLPTLSFGATSPVSVTGTSAATATLTVSTTAPSSATLIEPGGLTIPWDASGGASLACVLLIGIRSRRRVWRTSIGMLILLMAFASGLLACGGGGSSGGSGPSRAGTTAGTYKVIVTGASGSTKSTATVTLTVQ